MNHNHKKDLRKKYLNIRANLLKERSFSFKELHNYINTLDVDRVFSYVGHNGEPDPTSHDWTHKLALPKVTGLGKMDFHSWSKGAPLIENKWGLKEPQECVVCPTEHSVFLVPCVSVDLWGARIGMGGGYYDRYLSSCCFQLCVGIVHPEQIHQSAFPKEDHDVALGGYYDGSLLKIL